MNVGLKENIYVTKSFMPPIEEYNAYVAQIYKNGQLTNQGPLLRELEGKLSEYLNVDNFHYVTNGTIALQIAMKALDIEGGEIITTPFSFVATTSSILWEHCKPVFVDIEPNNYTIDVDKIEAAITPETRAIMAVHVFGYACDVEGIQQIADKYGLKVIYDAAHAFGAKFKGKSLLSYGDISTCSFHATKVYHTIEGGACVVRDKEISDRLDLIKRFGINGNEHFCLGINAKQSEFNAAMGLANFPYIDKIIEKRKEISELYDRELTGLIERPKTQKELEYNYSYYPIIFKSEADLSKALEALNRAEIYPRRYYDMSLNKLPYLDNSSSCPISEDICSRIVCLPLAPDFSEDVILEVCRILQESVGR